LVRLLILQVLLLMGWSLELLVASGPARRSVVSGWLPFISALLFFTGANLGLRFGVRIGWRESPGPGLAIPRPLALATCLLGAAAALVAWVRGESNYSLILQHGASSPAGKAWPMLIIAGAAMVLAVQERIARLDALALSAAVIAASLAGGRTVPGLILIMWVVRYTFLDGYRKLTLRMAVMTLACVAVAALLFSMIGFMRDSTFSGRQNSVALEYVGRQGYSWGPPFLWGAEATLGVVGEAALVTHSTVPKRRPFAGADVLLSDLLSFTPWVSRTVDPETMPPYWAAGMRVETSRPGGTPTTLYLLGGRWLVLLGALVYSALLGWLATLAIRSGNGAAKAYFLIVCATYCLGIYGTGTPTGGTALSLLAVAGSRLAQRWFEASRTARTAPVRSMDLDQADGSVSVGRGDLL
jgi:hypothetical protein